MYTEMIMVVGIMYVVRLVAEYSGTAHSSYRTTIVAACVAVLMLLAVLHDTDILYAVGEC